MIQEFKGKNVLVTGSAMGIGRGLSECFAREGANLILSDLEGQRQGLEEWAHELENTYQIRTWTFCVDLTDPDGPERLYESVSKEVVDTHILVNNAGICWFGCYKDMPHDRLQNMILLNCMAYAKLCRLFLPAMIERNEGGILNVSSVSAFQPVPTLGLYAATKAFTQSLSEALRGELPAGSRVVISTLNPPFTRTRLIEDAGVPSDYIPIMMSFMSVSDVTASGVKAFRKNRERFVPGLLNRILYLAVVRFLPHGLLVFSSRILTHRLSDLLPQSFLAILGMCDQKSDCRSKDPC